MNWFPRLNPFPRYSWSMNHGTPNITEHRVTQGLGVPNWDRCSWTMEAVVREYLTCITPNPAKIIPVTSSVIVVVRVPQVKNVFLYDISFTRKMFYFMVPWTPTYHFSTNHQGHPIEHILVQPMKYDMQATLLPWKLLLQLFSDAYIMVAQTVWWQSKKTGWSGDRATMACIVPKLW